MEEVRVGARMFLDIPSEVPVEVKIYSIENGMVSFEYLSLYPNQRAVLTMSDFLSVAGLGN